MTTQFDSNTFEHDYIIAALDHFMRELQTDKPRVQIIDKYAMALTSFMNGQIRQAVKNVLEPEPAKGAPAPDQTSGTGKAPEPLLSKDPPPPYEPRQAAELTGHGFEISDQGSRGGVDR